MEFTICTGPLPRPTLGGHPHVPPYPGPQPPGTATAPFSPAADQLPVNPRKLAAFLGAPVTTFLLAAAITIEALTAATGADVGPGIVGVLVGALAAIAAFLLVAWRWDRLSDAARHLLAGYAAFGLAFLFLSALSYVNVPGARQYLDVPLNLGVAAVVAVAVALVGRRVDRGSSSP